MVDQLPSYRDWPTLSQIERDHGVNRQIVRAFIIKHDVVHEYHPPAIYVPPAGMRALLPILDDYKRKLARAGRLSTVA